MYKCRNHLKCLSLVAQNGVQLEIGLFKSLYMSRVILQTLGFRMEAALAEMAFDDAKDVEDDNDFVNDKGAVIRLILLVIISDFHRSGRGHIWFRL